MTFQHYRICSHSTMYYKRHNRFTCLRVIFSVNENSIFVIYCIYIYLTCPSCLGCVYCGKDCVSVHLALSEPPATFYSYCIKVYVTFSLNLMYVTCYIHVLGFYTERHTSCIQ